MNKEKLEELYIKQSLPIEEIAKYFNLSGKSIRKWVKKFNLYRDPVISQIQRVEKQKQTNLEKYGVDSYSKTDQYKEKVKKTSIERYGVDNAAKSQEIKEKVKCNNLEKYGETNPLKVEEIKERIRLEQISNKGFAYPYQVNKDPESVKILATKESLEEYLKSLENKPTIDELAKKLNYSHYALLIRIKELDLLDKVQYFPIGSWSQRELPRESIQIMGSRNKLKEYLESFEDKPTLYELSDKLQYDRTTIGQKIQEYQLQDYIKYGSTTSSYEKELKRLFIDKFHKDRKILNSKYEIDLYNEDYKLGIEFNGNYWHSVDNKGVNYHQNKSLVAIDKSIRLIHIFEYEWLNPITRKKLITQINNLIDDKRITIYARKCKIRKISSWLSKEFLNENHLQGTDKAPLRYGLFFEDILIGVMTFSKPRFNKKYEYELSRLCWHRDYKVVGGAARLFKAFIKEYNPKSIISYCDIGKFTGEVYDKLGFRFIRYSAPNYVWCNNKGDIKTRYQCQKYKLIKQFPEYDGLTETEIMTMLGYWKIEDAGNAVYELIF